MEYYKSALKQDGFSYDEAQENTVKLLQSLYEELCDNTEKTGWLSSFFSGSKQKAPVRGLYLWGGVGRGKTFLMDIFYDALPFDNKLRLHFHRFMRRVHQELTLFKGETDPLDRIAEKLASEARVLCFDEFFVTDITDAMILANLLQGLFDRGVTLVATSNIVPDDLYKEGLQRARFLPAIDLLNKHTKVVNVDTGIDYRLRVLERVVLYHYPLDSSAESTMEDSFRRLVANQDEIKRGSTLGIESREIQALAVCEDAVWFDFHEICDGPRSQNDYIEIARLFHTVFISGVPVFDKRDDSARRFINLIDEFYDRNVNVVLSAEDALDQLYIEGRLSFEFERTKSRLQEMQSKEYLAKEHRS